MEKEHIIKILKIEQLTHDVKRFIVEKPKDFQFIPGQATDISINTSQLKNEKSPFTFTSLNENPHLEFTIKMYRERNRLTKKLESLKTGDSLLITDPFGAIYYQGAGVFIAGGAGITPFIAILRQLRKEKKLEGNALLFSNKTEKDIILKEEFDQMKNEGLEVLYTLTREKNSEYLNRHLDESFLKEKIKNFNQHFYICGPIRFVGEIQHTLQKLGADPETLVIET